MGTEKRYTNTLIAEYELMASTPREVYDLYKDRKENSDKYYWDGQVDEKTDLALWGRGDPLIKMAIAKYGSNEEIAKEILKGNDEALKLALLKNWSGQSFHDFPESLFDGDGLVSYLNSCSDQEFACIFSNPSIADLFLRDFFEGKKIWNDISEERQRIAVMAFAENPRSSKPNDDSFMDGYAEYSHNAVFSSCWELCAKVPVTKEWAIALSRLTEKLLPEGFPFKDEEIMPVIARWYPTKEMQEENKYDNEEQYKDGGYLSQWQTIRQNLTKLIAESSKHGNLAENPDIGIRCGFYRYGRLNIDQMKAAFAKDGEAAWQAMSSNASLWSNKDKRQVLHDVAWAADDLDGRSNLDNANQYNAFYERFKNQYPAMFKDDDDEDFESAAPEDEELPATKGYVFQLADTLQSTNLSNQARLERLEGLVTKIALFGGIAIAILFYKLS